MFLRYHLSLGITSRRKEYSPLHTNVKKIGKAQGGSNMTGTDLCVNKPQSVPVISEPPCTYTVTMWRVRTTTVAADKQKVLHKLSLRL